MGETNSVETVASFSRDDQLRLMRAFHRMPYAASIPKTDRIETVDDLVTVLERLVRELQATVKRQEMLEDEAFELRDLLRGGRRLFRHLMGEDKGNARTD